ncbi:hypothetical protein Mal4_26430 [Maioricimonas rarisocia]|uniref:Uncharacterized protein n=1 Tax=Maioricimonas rarisocia TaxID=2528026 RepID=A0A517Z755_9PLAN|nr:hypothetical protein [Maioricimonas rarisocia]QDU38316.1 hypothetical protein Mal4_26430 [Maioricimonas rarisocia]
MLDPVQAADIDNETADCDGEEWISVGSRWRVWWLILPAGCCVAALAMSLLSLVADRPAAVRWTMLVASVAAIWAIGSAVSIWRTRRWIRIRHDGFEVHTRRDETFYTDGQVSGLACLRIPDFHAGRLTSEQRQLTLWIDGGPAPTRIEAVNQFAPAAPDPLQPLIDRLQRRLLENAEDALRRHIPVEGERWQWDGQFLDYQLSSQKSGRVSIDEVSSVECLSGELRVWKSREPLPFLAIPLSRRDAWLLRALLESAIAARGDSTPVPDSSGDFGRLLFERRPTRLFGWVVTTMGLAVVAIATLLIAVGLARGRWPTVAIGLALLPAGGVVVYAGMRLIRSVLRCHEAGLLKTGFVGTTELRFDEIDVFSFDARRQYSHGRYSGTMITLIFANHSRPSAGIFHTETIPHVTDELEYLRERVSEHIARRMARMYAMTRVVQWTPELWFEETGLRYVRRSFWRRRPPRIIPYDAILEYEVDQDWLHIWSNEQERAVVKVRTSAPNFHPGLIVLEGLVGPMEREANGAAPSVPVPNRDPQEAADQGRQSAFESVFQSRLRDRNQ